jgi:cell division protein FtsB
VRSRRPAFTGRAAILALVVVGLTLAVAGPFRQFLVQRGQIADLKAKVAEQQRRVDALREQHEKWQDPNYVEEQARQRLHFVKPGEVDYIQLDDDPTSDPTPAPATGTPAAPVDGRAWYSKLWSTVVQADAAGGAR